MTDKEKDLLEMSKLLATMAMQSVDYEDYWIPWELKDYYEQKALKLLRELKEQDKNEELRKKIKR